MQKTTKKIDILRHVRPVPILFSSNNIFQGLNIHISSLLHKPVI